ncbi:MAG: DUF4419 domain-containing protein [Candidatus Obscuribacterales bacterium]|nr:DUF4419 domain-containing protein [Candidatus Obscuribacterales bacterium]
MSNFPSPKQILDQRQAKVDELLAACRKAVEGYTGKSSVMVRSADYEQQTISAAIGVLEGSGWSCVVSADDNLFISAAETKPATTVTAPTVVVAGPASTATPAVVAEPKPALPVTASNGRTFKVSKVDPPRQSFKAITAYAAFAKMLGAPVEACSLGGRTPIQAHGFHAFFEAAHQAFSGHFPLAFGPDDIWLAISQGFARHVNQKPEDYRKCFVAHEGKKEIAVRRDQFVLGSVHNDWTDVFSEFSTAIGKHIGQENHSLLTANFSTTGAIERAASEVVLMNCVQAYFRYKVNTLCGIPEVTLLGTPEDWTVVIEKTKKLAGFGGLAWWLDQVYPILEQLQATASGKEVDLSFWQNLYKGEYHSGGFQAEGWLMKLAPYLRYYDEKYHQNPLLTERSSRNGGVGTATLPSSLSFVPFIWNYFGDEHQYQFIAGHAGIEQDPATQALRPRMGWAVRPAPAK